VNEAPRYLLERWTSEIKELFDESERADVLDWLTQFHKERRLRLCTPDGGIVFVAAANPADEGAEPTVDDAIALVTELLRLARTGQRWQQVVEGGPTQGAA